MSVTTTVALSPSLPSAHANATAQQELKSIHVLDALVVLADATEHWHFGGKQFAGDYELSSLIETGQARKLVQNSLRRFNSIQQGSKSFHLPLVLQLLLNTFSEPLILERLIFRVIPIWCF